MIPYDPSNYAPGEGYISSQSSDLIKFADDDSTIYGPPNPILHALSEVDDDTSSTIGTSYVPTILTPAETINGDEMSSEVEDDETGETVSMLATITSPVEIEFRGHEETIDSAKHLVMPSEEKEVFQAPEAIIPGVTQNEQDDVEENNVKKEVAFSRLENLYRGWCKCLTFHVICSLSLLNSKQLCSSC